MHPILLTIGPLEFRSHDVMVVLGAILSFVLFIRVTRKTAITPRDILSGIAIIFPITYLLIYLNGVLFRLLVAGWVDYRVSLAFDTASFGMVLGILLTGYIAAKWRRLPAGFVLDQIALVLPLAQAVGRIGCFLEGCCYGLETDSLIGMYLPSHSGVWANRYPTQLILAVFDLALFALLWSRREKVRVDGNLTFLYLFCFTLGRISIDSLRELPQVLGVLSPHQLASIVILSVTAYTLFELRILRRKQKSMAS